MKFKNIEHDWKNRINRKNSNFIPRFPYNHLFINIRRKRGKIEKTI